MPRDRRSTSFTASASDLYGHMRRPPSAGPSTVLWIATMAFRPASALWQNTTSSWPVLAMVSKIIATVTPWIDVARRPRRLRCGHAARSMVVRDEIDRPDQGRGDQSKRQV